jgi:NAD(P)-dependent dehydrogenase (short-subunit alcohol dehydrogenase family)
MQMSERLVGKVAVVTGAGQGIGRSSALAFCDEGATVWAIDRNAETLATLADENPAISTAVLDVTDAAAIAAFAESLSTVHVLFNCAGYVHTGTILDCEEAEWDTTMNVNVKSMYLLCRALIPLMIDGGSIVNMASVISNISGVPSRFAYGASKAAVVGLTKSIAADFASEGIRCNAIAPGTVDSPSLLERMQQFDDPTAALAQFTARQPMGRIGSPSQIAALALYLASDESGYTTGSVHVIDGGMTL